MIQTVTGAIDNTDLGNVLMHEHISCSSLSFQKAFGMSWLNEEHLKALSCETLQQMKQNYNMGLLVDATPIDLGRNATLLREISEASGVKIVASTGFYYLQSIEVLNNDASYIAKWFIGECENGIGNTGIKPGILKCATGNVGITDDNQKKLSALGIVQSQTGLPLYVHCEHYEDIAHKQIDLLLQNGADAKKIIIGHASLRPDAAYLEEILEKGCYICMDQCHCCGHDVKILADTLLKLCQKGYTDKILISNDYCIHSDFCNGDTNGLHLSAAQHAERLGFVFTKVYAAYLCAGGSEKDWNTMLRENPVCVLDVG